MRESSIVARSYAASIFELANRHNLLDEFTAKIYACKNATKISSIKMPIAIRIGTGAVHNEPAIPASTYIPVNANTTA